MNMHLEISTMMPSADVIKMVLPVIVNDKI